MIVLAPSTTDDLDFVLAAESDAATSAFLIPWTRERHLGAMHDPDCLHRIMRQPGSSLRPEYEVSRSNAAGGR